MYIEYLTQCLIHNNSSTNSLLLSLSSITNTPMYFSIVHGCIIVQWSQMDFSSKHGLTSRNSSVGCVNYLISLSLFLYLKC